MLNTRNPYWLREALTASGMTIVDLSRKAKVDRSTITRLVPSDKHPTPMLPQVRTLHKIEVALGLHAGGEA